MGVVVVVGVVANIVLSLPSATGKRRFSTTLDDENEENEDDVFQPINKQPRITIGGVGSSPGNTASGKGKEKEQEKGKEKERERSPSGEAAAVEDKNVFVDIRDLTQRSIAKTQARSTPPCTFLSLSHAHIHIHTRAHTLCTRSLTINA